MSPRILVVEDEPDIAAIVADYLRHAGYTVEHQAEGRAALASLITTQPDLTLLDIMLPGMDGLEILRQARRHTQHPIIMLTARVEEVDRLIGLELTTSANRFHRARWWPASRPCCAAPLPHKSRQPTRQPPPPWCWTNRTGKPHCTAGRWD